jgi:hypothetical protein
MVHLLLIEEQEVVDVAIAYCDNGGECEVKADQMMRRVGRRFGVECGVCGALKSLGGGGWQADLRRYCSEECRASKMMMRFVSLGEETLSLEAGRRVWKGSAALH